MAGPAPEFDPNVIEEALLRALYGYWQSKRQDGRLPSRRDVDPREMGRFLLPNLLFVDTAETLGEFRYRLFGTELSRGFEHDRTGVRFADLPQIENYDEIYEGYWRTYRDGVVVYFSGQIVSSRKSWLGYSRLTLPLSTDGVQVDKILGGIVFSSEGSYSRWL